MSTSWGLPSAFYDPFFSEPLLGADFDMLDFDMGPSEWSGQPGGGASWPQLAGRGGEPSRAVQAGQQQQQPGGNRAQRRAARRTARVNLLQEEGSLALTLHSIASTAVPTCSRPCALHLLCAVSALSVCRQVPRVRRGGGPHQERPVRRTRGQHAQGEYTRSHAEAVQRSECGSLSHCPLVHLPACVLFVRLSRHRCAARRYTRTRRRSSSSESTSRDSRSRAELPSKDRRASSRRRRRRSSSRPADRAQARLRARRLS